MRNMFIALVMLVAGASHAGEPAATKGPSDTNIAAIAVAANAIDVEAGNLALSKSTNAEVKKFAQLMVNDHSAVNKQAGELAAKLKLTPEDDDTARTLKKNAAETLTKLKALNGAEFDRAYVANEVAYHKAVLDAVDTLLIPNTKNGELKALLAKVRPVIAEHLKHAEMMQKDMK